MGKRAVDDISLAALAAKLRSRSAAPAPAMVFPNDFMDQVDLVHEQGRTEGIAEGKADCTAQHFVHTFAGNGGSSVSFPVPFEPDAVQIIGFSPLANTKPHALAMFTCDCRAFGTLGGLATYGNAAGTLSTSMQTTNSVLSRYAYTGDGVLTIKDIAASVIFAPEYRYTAVAVKYTRQSDAERIAAFVDALTGSGTVTLNQAKVRAAFHDNEWATLIARKPGWTFTWI